MKNPFKRQVEIERLNYSKERDALAEQYRSLVDRAGIAAEITHCQEILEPDYFEDQHLPPSFTRARKRAETQQDARKFEQYRYRLRKTVFGVSDLAVRREIISCERKFRKIKLESLERDLWDAHRRRNQLGKFGVSQLGAAVGGASSVIIGWRLGGNMWGTAVGVFAVIIAIHFVVAEQRRMLDEADAEMSDLEDNVDEAFGQEVFTPYEEGTGESGEEPETERA
jgi:hypothetical protein